MSNLRRVGKAAEDRAARFLMEKGYTIVTRRYNAKGGEIDLIALDGDMMVFVEVKERRAAGFIPEEAMSRQKLECLGRARHEYLGVIGEPNRLSRFDMIAIDAKGIRHYEDAFRV